uniref:Uncharacterized protein n=1 Tax=Siphoviridae sp. ctCsv15 TaxID=2826195 RepID=A0A8S5LYT9_9CAUD|nr:MAG TPA: hypothetical protein [Siphoviridae sp. ctCsv15]
MCSQCIHIETYQQLPLQTHKNIVFLILQKQSVCCILSNFYKRNQTEPDLVPFVL